MNVGSLFSGIGGIDLGLERAGMRVVWQAESDEYCRGVLARHWSSVHCYHDVRDIDATAPRVDVLAGGFPCQPISHAGKGLAQADERWLWPEFARVIRLLRPRFVIVENVPGLLAPVRDRGTGRIIGPAPIGEVLGDLATLGFDAEWTVFGAWQVGAPHKRDRVWIVAADAERVQLRIEPGWLSGPGRADPAEPRDDGAQGFVPNSCGARLEGHRQGGTARDDGSERSLADAEGERRQPGPGDGQPVRPGAAQIEPEGRAALQPAAGRRAHDWPSEPDVGRVAHGIPNRVDRLRALGNAVVPACAEHIGRLVIQHYHSTEGRLSPDPVTDQEHS